MRNQRRRPVLAVALTGALLVAACSSGSDDTSSDDTAPEATTEVDATEPDDSEPEESDPEGDAGEDDAPAEEPDEPAPLEDEDQITSEGEGAAEIGDPVAGGEITWGLTNDGTGFDTTGAVAPGSIRVITALGFTRRPGCQRRLAAQPRRERRSER